jgi:TPR repeat protein
VESGKASWHTLTTSDKNLMAEVVTMWTTAANQGYANAQYNLSCVYHTGEGITKDLEKEVRWTRKAADQGHAIAQSNLGVKYGTGLGVSQDLKEAARWTRKAAEQGDANAQFNLGLKYCLAEGVAQDFEKAVRWFQKAADKGDAKAQEALARIGAISTGARAILPQLARENRGIPPAASTEAAPSMAPPISTRKCASCGRGCEKGVKLKPCSRCKSVFYCGEECQQAHWKAGHKTNCRPSRP